MIYSIQDLFNFLQKNSVKYGIDSRIKLQEYPDRIVLDDDSIVYFDVSDDICRVSIRTEHDPSVGIFGDLLYNITERGIEEMPAYDCWKNFMSKTLSYEESSDHYHFMRRIAQLVLDYIKSKNIQ